MGVKRVPPKKKKKKTKESKLIEQLRKRFGDKEVESLLNSIENETPEGHPGDLPPGGREVQPKGGWDSPSVEWETVRQHIKSGGPVKKKRKTMNKGGSVKSYNY